MHSEAGLDCPGVTPSSLRIYEFMIVELLPGGGSENALKGSTEWSILTTLGLTRGRFLIGGGQQLNGPPCAISRQQMVSIVDEVCRG